MCLLQEATRFLQHYSSNPSCLNQQGNQQGTEDCVQFVPSNSNHNVPLAPLTRRDRDGVSGQSRRVLHVENFQALFAPYSQRPRPSAISSVQILYILQQKKLGIIIIIIIIIIFNYKLCFD